MFHVTTFPLILWLTCVVPVRCDDPNPLEMSEPVACLEIKGYEDYEAMDEAVITPQEKLLIYTRVSGHSFEQVKTKYQAHLTQDVNIRKKGEKRVVWGRKKVVDYTTPESSKPPERLYLSTSLGLKGLKPGEYEAELILHDALDPERTATRTLSFKMVSQRPTGDSEKADKPKSKSGSD